MSLHTKLQFASYFNNFLSGWLILSIWTKFWLRCICLKNSSRQTGWLLCNKRCQVMDHQCRTLWYFCCFCKRGSLFWLQRNHRFCRGSWYTRFNHRQERRQIGHSSFKHMSDYFWRRQGTLHLPRFVVFCIHLSLVTTWNLLRCLLRMSSGRLDMAINMPFKL